MNEHRDIDRLSLIQTLNSIPQEQLFQIIFALKVPQENIPLNISQGQQVFALLRWAESGLGCGLEEVETVLNRIIKPPSPANHNEPQPTVDIMPDPVGLKTPNGVDYTKLEQLLKQAKWKEADQETADRMLQAIGENSWLNVGSENIENFPCEDLYIIDQLWVKYSGELVILAITIDKLNQRGSLDKLREDIISEVRSIGARTLELSRQNRADVITEIDITRVFDDFIGEEYEAYNAPLQYETENLTDRLEFHVNRYKNENFKKAHYYYPIFSLPDRRAAQDWMKRVYKFYKKLNSDGGLTSDEKNKVTFYVPAPHYEFSQDIIPIS